MPTITLEDLEKAYTMLFDELAKDLSIDSTSVVTAGLRNPTFLVMAFEAQASIERFLDDATIDLDKAKDAGKLKLAELELKIKSRPEAYDLDSKPTVGQVSARALIDPSYQLANQEVEHISRKIAKFKEGRTRFIGLVKGFQQRKNMLELTSEQIIFGLHGDTQKSGSTVRRVQNQLESKGD